MSQPLLIGYRGNAPRRRRRSKKPKSSAAQALALAKRNQRKIGSVIEMVENEDTYVAVMDPAPVIHFLNLAGDGRRTRITSVAVKGLIRRNLASALVDDWRVDLVLDRTPIGDGTLMTAQDLYGDALPEIGEFKSLANKERFKILRSAFGAFSDVSVEHQVINWYVKLNLIALSDTDNSWTENGVIKNALYLVYYTTAVANHPIPALTTRVLCMDGNA